MKNFKSFSFLRFLRSKHLKRNITFLIIISILNVATGCYYYLIKTNNKPNTKDIIELQTNHKMIFIHSGAEVKILKVTSIENNILNESI